MEENIKMIYATMNYIESKQTPDLIIHIDFLNPPPKKKTQKNVDAVPCKFIYEIKTTLFLIYPIKERFFFYKEVFCIRMLHHKQRLIGLPLRRKHLHTQG